MWLILTMTAFWLIRIWEPVNLPEGLFLPELLGAVGLAILLAGVARFFWRLGVHSYLGASA